MRNITNILPSDSSPACLAAGSTRLAAPLHAGPKPCRGKTAWHLTGLFVSILQVNLALASSTSEKSCKAVQDVCLPLLLFDPTSGSHRDDPRNPLIAVSFYDPHNSMHKNARCFGSVQLRLLRRTRCNAFHRRSCRW